MKEREVKELAFGHLTKDERVVNRVILDEQTKEVIVDKCVSVEQTVEKVIEVPQEVLVQNQVAVDREVPFEVVKK